MSTDTTNGIVEVDGTSVEGIGSSELPADVADRVVVVPWGEVGSTNGRFLVDAESARRAIEAFESQGNDLPIDYEHQTLGGEYSSPSGQAPAAGWIKRLEAVEGEGLVACVQWTQPAIVQLSARQYRYLSPVVVVSKRDRRLVGLHSAALTNKPAIAGMRPIVNRAKPARIDHTEQVGDPAEEDNSMQKAWETLRGRVALDPSADEEAVLVCAAERIEALETQLACREAEDVVAEAMKSGRLVSAQKEWAVELVLRDAEAFATWLADAPVIVPHGQLAPPDGTSGEESGRAGLSSGARQEYRSSRLLQSLTSEDAYMAEAVRSAESVSNVEIG